MPQFPQKRFRGPRISASVVLYESPTEEIAGLVTALTRDRLSLHVTFVDNSPTDALRAVVEGAGAEYLRPGKNLGYGEGHNFAMRRVIDRSTYHLVCNPDITCSLETIRQLAEFMDRDSGVGLVMPQVLYPDGRPQHLCKRLPTPVDLMIRRFLPSRLGLLQAGRDLYQLRHLDMHQARLIPSLSGCFMFLRTDVLRQTGLFDPRFFMYMEDVDLCRRVGMVSKTVFYPEVSILHGYSKGSYKNSRLLRYHMTSAIRYFNKWGWMRDPERRFLNSRTGVYSASARPQPAALDLPVQLEVS